MMRKICLDPLKELRRAVGRLELSKGKCIARRNARRAFLRAVNAAKKHYLETHPCIDEAGNEIVVKRGRGLRCPACNVPMQSVKFFATHWMNKHCQPDTYITRRKEVKCRCGKSYGYGKSALRMFCCHVRGLKDIQSHFTLGALASIGSNNGRAK